MVSYIERYGSSSRVNVYNCSDGKITSKRKESEKWQSIKHILRAVFLPQGYPESVSDDYLEYQLWDTLQAFSSSITGALATQAVLKGVGVGDSEATVMAATITWLLKDGTGMVGRILFAWMKGSSLDSDCKKWRMYADILNDAAILLDILSPYFTSLFTIIVCISGIMRSIVGVAGGATRAAITQHQARRNNMADVAAKDGSQETLVNLAGLVVSLVVVPLVSGNVIFIWTLFVAFTISHIYSNYRAVTCVVMETFNQSRYSIVVADYVTIGIVPRIKEVNKRESVLLNTSSHYNTNMGCSYDKLLPSNNSTGSIPDPSSYPHNEAYILNVDVEKREVNISLKVEAGPLDQLKACYQAELVKLCLQPPPHLQLFQAQHKDLEIFKNLLSYPSKGNLKDLVSSTHSVVTDTWSSFISSVVAKGWKVDHVMLDADEWRLKVY